MSIREKVYYLASIKETFLFIKKGLNGVNKLLASNVLDNKVYYLAYNYIVLDLEEGLSNLIDCGIFVSRYIIYSCEYSTR